MKIVPEGLHDIVVTGLRFAGRFYRSLYGWFVTLFFLWQGLFLCGAIHKWWPTAFLQDGIDVALTASLMISVHVLVLLNSLAFLREGSPIISGVQCAEHLEESEVKVARDLYDTFLWGLFASVFLAGSVAFLILARWHGWVNFSWPEVMQINEVCSVTLFGVFLLADSCGYKVCKLALKNERCFGTHDCDAFRRCAAEIKLFISGVDLPGFLGLVFILVLSVSVYPSRVEFFYWRGFIAGAIGLHIAFSQLALALLASRDEQPAIKLIKKSQKDEITLSTTQSATA